MTDMVKSAPYGEGESARLERCSEEAQLRKADAQIESGRLRLLKQERLITALKASGRPMVEAERLAALFRDTLAEWERHRALIVQRLAYLEAALRNGPTSA
jgi:hypothetical protein